MVFYIENLVSNSIGVSIGVSKDISIGVSIGFSQTQSNVIFYACPKIRSLRSNTLLGRHVSPVDSNF